MKKITIVACLVAGSLVLSAHFGRCHRKNAAAAPPSGSLVSDFGVGGVLTIDPSPGVDIPRGVAFGTAHFYIVGSDATLGGGDTRWWIQKRHLSDGSPVSSFGTDGEITENPSSGDDLIWAIAIDSDWMYLFGYDDDPASPGNRRWRIEKRSLTDGSLDQGFGNLGVVISDPSPTGSEDKPESMAIDSTHMYLVGRDDVPGPAKPQWRIEKRSLTDGKTDDQFGLQGVIQINPSDFYDWPSSVVIDSTYMYIVGTDQGAGMNDHQWRIEKRRLDDGTPDLDFGQNGVVTTNPSTGEDVADHAAIAGEYVFVAGRDESAGPGDIQWRIEKRRLDNGSLVTGFGTGGVLSINPSPGSESSFGVTPDPASTAIYVTGDDLSPGGGDGQWRCEKRSAIDGSPILDFGTGGLVTHNPSGGPDLCGRVFLGVTPSEFIYLGGIDFEPGVLTNLRVRLEKRYK